MSGSRNRPLNNNNDDIYQSGAAGTHIGGGSSGSTVDVMVWETLSDFTRQYHPRKEFASVELGHGKVLIMGGQSSSSSSSSGDDNDERIQNTSTTSTLSTVELLEWNVRRMWRFPSLKRGRFGHTAVNVNGLVVVAGGADAETNVLASVESFQFSSTSTTFATTSSSRSKRREWITQIEEMETPRLYAAAVAVPHQSAVVVLGGRDDCFQEVDTVEVGTVQSNEGQNIITWSTLKQPLPSPRFGCAAALVDDNKILVMGGYDGHLWQNDCYMYEFSYDHQHGSSLADTDNQNGVWSDMPPMLETIRFAKAVTFHRYVLVMGETEEGNNSLQCFDSHKRKWLWKRIGHNCPPLENINIHQPNLYGFAAQPFSNSDSSTTIATSSIYRCELSKIDYQMASDCMPVAVGAAASVDSDLIDAPTILAMDPVLVTVDEDGSGNGAEKMNGSKHQRLSSSSLASLLELPDDSGVTLRNVTRIMLPSEKSHFTGQLRKKDGSWVPHGEGLEVWLDHKDGEDTVTSELKNSYYRGRFVDGYRHGLGEMYLRVEDKHYFGQFNYGSWDGIGTLKLKNRGFSYFGEFVAGEMTGLGRCSCRVKNGREWVQKTYSGYFRKGRAHGLGALSNFSTGKIEEYREFDNEDLFNLGTHGRQVSPDASDIDI